MEACLMITLYTPQFYMRMPCRPFFFSSLGIYGCVKVKAVPDPNPNQVARLCEIIE